MIKDRNLKTLKKLGLPFPLKSSSRDGYEFLFFPDFPEFLLQLATVRSIPRNYPVVTWEAFFSKLIAVNTLGNN
jgi:hypothetical protein